MESNYTENTVFATTIAVVATATFLFISIPTAQALLVAGMAWMVVEKLENNPVVYE